MLPHAVAYSAHAAPLAIQHLAETLQESDVALGLRRFAEGIGGPIRLDDIGVSISDAPRIVETLMKKDFANPRPLERQPVIAMVERIIRGDAPGPV